MLNWLFRERICRRIAAGVVVGIVQPDGHCRLQPIVRSTAPMRPLPTSAKSRSNCSLSAPRYAGGTTRGLSDTIVNYGFADRWELVLQTTPQVPPEGFGPISVSNAALLKYVVKPGALQDKTGWSIATEFGAVFGVPRVGCQQRRGHVGRDSFAAVGVGHCPPQRCRTLTPDQHRSVSRRDHRRPEQVEGSTGRGVLFRTTSSTGSKHTPPWSAPFGK